ERKPTGLPVSASHRSPQVRFSRSRLTAVLHCIASAFGDGYWFDEVYMLAIGRYHLDWGSADQPPYATTASSAAPSSRCTWGSWPPRAAPTTSPGCTRRWRRPARSGCSGAEKPPRTGGAG